MLVLGYTPNAFQYVTFTGRTDGMYDAGFRGSSWDWDNDENRTNRSADLLYTGESRGGRASWEVQTSYFRDLDDLRWGAEVRRSGSSPVPGVDLDHNRRRQTGFLLRGSTTFQAIDATDANEVQIGVDTEWSQVRSTRVCEPLPGLTASQVAPFDNNSNSRNLGLFVEDVQHLLDDRLIVRGGMRFDAGQHEIRATPNVVNLLERTESYDSITYRFGTVVKATENTAIRFSVGTGSGCAISTRQSATSVPTGLSECTRHRAPCCYGPSHRSWIGQLTGTYYGPVWYNTEENLLIPFGEPSRGTIHVKNRFMTWNLRGRYALPSGVWLTAAVNNLFNKNEHPLFIAINKAPLLANTALSNGGVGNSMPGRAFVVGFEVRR